MRRMWVVLPQKLTYAMFLFVVGFATADIRATSPECEADLLRSAELYLANGSFDALSDVWSRLLIMREKRLEDTDLLITEAKHSLMLSRHLASLEAADRAKLLASTKTLATLHTELAQFGPHRAARTADATCEQFAELYGRDHYMFGAALIESAITSCYAADFAEAERKASQAMALIAARFGRGCPAYVNGLYVRAIARHMLHIDGWLVVETEANEIRKSLKRDGNFDLTGGAYCLHKVCRGFLIVENIEGSAAAAQSESNYWAEVDIVTPAKCTAFIDIALSRSAGGDNHALDEIRAAINLAQITPLMSSTLESQVNRDAAVIFARFRSAREAEACITKAQKLAEDAKDVDAIAQSIHAKARLLLDKDPVEAGRLCTEACKLFVDAHGVNSPEVVNVLLTFGVCLREGGEFDKASMTFEDALAKYEVLYGAESKASADVRLHLALAQMKAGNIVAAEEEAQKALNTYEGAFGAEYSSTCEAKRVLTDIRVRLRPGGDL